MAKLPERIKLDISTVTIVKVALVILGLWVLYVARDIAFLFFIVLVIVAALGPLVDRMSKYIPRLLAVIILSIIFIGVLVAIGFLLVPPIIVQLKHLGENLPQILQKYGPLYHAFQNYISNYQQGLFNLSSQIGGVTNGIYTTTVGFISGIVVFLTILVLSFYMLLQREAIPNFINQIVPEDYRERIIIVAKKIAEKMGSWLRGQALLMVAIGLLDGIALTALGLPYALTLAVWGGLVEVIPYIGPWLGLVPALVIAFTISPFKALIVLIAYVVIQQLESSILAPKIMEKAVGLSPVIIILALLIGARLAGILGILIAVPLAAAISVVIQEWPEIRKIRQENA